MDEREFYDYIQEHYNLGGTASRLVHNIIEYVKDQNFVDAEDAQSHLKSLFDGAFGIEEHEILLYRAPECTRCCSGYAPGWDYETDGDEPLCSRCKKEQEQPTKVTYRKIKKGGDIIAFFPELPANWGNVLSYMRIGQHSEASYQFYLTGTMRASESEYSALHKELCGIYDEGLAVVSKISQTMLN